MFLFFYSLCGTVLCLQWEPDVIGLALLYLASRFTKIEIKDWHGRIAGCSTPWWSALAQDDLLTTDILEGNNCQMESCIFLSVNI